MCGRVNVKTSLDEMLRSFAFASRSEEVEAMANGFPRWNGAPKQDYFLIIQQPDIRSPEFLRANWGLIPRRTTDPRKLPLLINARSETVATNGYFKFPYATQRALMPITGYFEWQDIHGTGKDKQPYAIAMADGSPFCLAAIWDTWRDPQNSAANVRTFAILTCEPNSLMGTIHDRMPVILHREDYQRWLDPEERDPRDLLKPFPAESMKMWPIGRKVGNYRNDTPDILDPVEPEDGTLS